MRDGSTRELDRGDAGSRGSLASFLERFEVALVLVQGGADGSEFEVLTSPLVVGRGDDCGLPFDDPAMSKQHAALEFADAGFRIRDLGSRNGTFLNDREVKTAELEHGDRLRLGEHVFQLVVAPRTRTPRTYVLSDEE